MRHIFYIACIMLVGCSTLPDTVSECSDLYSDEVEADQCRADVIQSEDRRVRRHEQRRKDDANAQYCWFRYRAGYDKFSERCVYVPGYGGGWGWRGRVW